ncbi:hypothetical protein H0H92_000031 [Tricholoma furcatifolium]|nr:hypothetical protein H0H92_000031 [Tricholoma furcatifolium]
MAYQDPYQQQSGRLQHQRHYSESTPEFDPYATNPSHQTYDQAGAAQSYDTYGYTDEHYDNNYPPNRVLSQRSGVLRQNESKDTSIETGGYGEKTPGALRRYRYEHQGALWTKGGRGRCIGRFCCCTLMTVVLLFVCIVLALALWIRPPNITIGDVNTISQSGSSIVTISNGIQVNLGVNISVNNPNYFAVDFKDIDAQIFYPINNTQIGEGNATNVVFNANTLTNWTFPFSLTYITTDDPQGLIIEDLASKCGVTGKKSDITVNYKITLALRVLFITVSPVVSNSMTFACPLDASELEPILQAFGFGG